jgi:carboxyl-terminal processing protease
VRVAQSNAEPVDVEGMPLDKIVEQIRGPKGTQVTLTVIPFDAPDMSVRKDVTLIRDEIKLDEKDAKARLYEIPDAPTAASRLGVIDFTSFYANSEGLSAGEGAGPVKSLTDDVEVLIKRLKRENVGGIILDLRQNGGGYLEEAIRLTGLFVHPGPVVQTKDAAGEIDTDSCRRRAILYDGPLIVLVSRLSASASEILAGALQDYNRAIIVGDHCTFGKGTVQTVQPLGHSVASYCRQKHIPYDPNYDPGSLKITIKKFYRAGGVSTQFKGVVSDIELPSVLNFATNEVGESALPNALACDEVGSANPENLNRVRPYLPELLNGSRQRVAASKDFAYIQQDIAEFLKQQADKSVSLNLAERKAEQEAKTAREEAIKKERAARPKSDEKVFEITLTNADLPQLQPLSLNTNSATPLASSEPAFGGESDLDEDAAASEPAVDPVLEEAKHILADYIELMNKEPVISKAP